MKIHIVKKNDTLYNLANKYNVELESIIAINPQIQDPDKIDVGMKVKIPSNPQPVEPPSSEHAHKHIVKQGDSLWKLGKAWEIPLQAMIKANPQLKNPNVLMTGDIVYIPKLNSAPMHEMQGQKVSTMPFPEAAPMVSPMPESPTQQEMQAPMPELPMMPQQPMASEMPSYEGPTGDISPHTPSMQSPEEITPAEPMPASEEPSWSMPPVMPKEPMMAEPQMHDLHKPYQQVQNPFAQFHIQSTEVFAFSEPLEHDHEPLASNLPEMPMYGGHQPYTGSYPAHPVQPAYPVKGCGCGCGGGSGAGSHTQPWQAFPAYPAYSTSPAYPPMEMAYSPSYMQPGPGMYPYSMMPMPCYPMTGGDYPMGMAYGAGHPGMPFMYPAAPDTSHAAHQAHIHQWPDNRDQVQNQVEEQVREASSGKTISKSAGKAAGTSKKTKQTSSQDSLQAQSRKQQAREDRADPKANLPWINV